MTSLLGSLTCLRMTCLSPRGCSSRKELPSLNSLGPRTTLLIVLLPSVFLVIFLLLPITLFEKFVLWTMNVTHSQLRRTFIPLLVGEVLLMVMLTSFWSYLNEGRHSGSWSRLRKRFSKALNLLRRSNLDFLTILSELAGGSSRKD